MSKRTPADYLRDMLHELDDVSAFTTEGKTAFMTNAMVYKAVMHSYVNIGEIAKRLPDELRIAHPQIDWRRLIGFRDFLAHHYEEVMLDFVWDAVEDLPNLKAALEAILADLDNAAE